MPLMSTAADPLGPCLSGPLPRTLPRRRQGVYVFGGISRGAAPCPKWRGCVLRFETYKRAEPLSYWVCILMLLDKIYHNNLF